MKQYMLPYRNQKQIMMGLRAWGQHQNRYYAAGKVYMWLRLTSAKGQTARVSHVTTQQAVATAITTTLSACKLKLVTETPEQTKSPCISIDIASRC